MQVLQTVSEEHVAQALGQSLQCLDGVVAKKYPAKQLQDPLLLFVADATHCLQAVALVQTPHPEEHAVQTPLKSKNPALHWQVCEGSAKNLLVSLIQRVQIVVVRTD